MAATLPPHPESESASADGARYLRLGEILIDRGKIEAEDLERALELQQERGDKIGKILVDMGSSRSAMCSRRSPIRLGVPLVAVDGVPALGPGDRRPLAPLPAPVPRLPDGPRRLHA